MSVPTSTSQSARLGRSTRLTIVAVLAAAIVVAACAIAKYTAGTGSRPTRHTAPTQASGLGGLTPQERQYALGVLSLPPDQLRAAFGTDRQSVQSQPNNAKITVRSTETLSARDVTDGTIAGKGHFTSSGAIADHGAVFDYRTVRGNKILIRRVAAGEKGTITFLITIDTTEPPTALGLWTITSATNRYKGLWGNGRQTVDNYASTPAIFTLAGTVSQ